jgi:hypothetical protein
VLDYASVLPSFGIGHEYIIEMMFVIFIYIYVCAA